MPLLLLLGQCVAMFGASFLVGSLPLMFKSASSGRTLKAISVFGMGILVGAALTIIIPEGVSTIYGSLPDDYEHTESTVKAVGLSLLSGFALMLLIESLTPHPPHTPPSTPLASPSLTPDSPHSPLENEHRSRSSSASSDRLSRPVPQHMTSQTPIIPKRLHVRDHETSMKYTGGSTHSSISKGDNMRGLNATLGMVIHGAADGIALGASSLSGSGSLGLIIFLAVLVHKGPTALGLTTTLLSLHLTPTMIRKRLLIFSFAAPLGAILTYLIVGLFGAKSSSGHHKDQPDGLEWWTGIALLFSGGSFLYVATVIQPLSDPEPHKHSDHDQAESGHYHGDNDEEYIGRYARTGLLVTGMVFPICLSALVGDHH